MSLRLDKLCRCWHIDVVGSLLCVALTSAAYLAAVRPLVGGYESFNGKQARLKAGRREASRLAAGSAAYKSQLEAVGQALAAGSIELQPTSNVNRHVAALADLVTQSGLKADDIQLGKVRHENRYDSVPISLGGRGGYADCTRLLRRLSQALPDTHVASFQLDGNPASPDAEAAFRLELLWLAAPSAGSAAK